MRKTEDSLFYNSKKFLNIDFIKKLFSLVKDNSFLIFIAYVVGTLAVLIRNYFIGLPFSPIGLLQAFIIFIYILLFFLSYIFLEMLYIRFFHEFKKKHYGTSFLFLICIGSSLLVLFIVFTILLGDYALAFIIVSFIYIGYLIYTVVLNNDIGFSLFITLLVLFLLLLFIPIQFGGLKGQKVMFNEYDNNICFLYTYYGNYDGLYEFKSNDDILLIPIEKGYILYNYKVKK